MPLIEINDLATIGSVRDTPAYMLPPEAVTLALNMRVLDGGLERLQGWEQVFGTPLFAPHFAMAVRTPSTTFWLYVSLVAAAGFDGTTHTDITRAAGPYTANATEQWNGTLLGGIPIVNNGIDVPQFWSPTTLATKLQNLTNWPATTRAKVIRAFGPFLMAIGVSKAGTLFPHMVKWSHPAVPGSVPSSWDETDPTKDTGEIDLPDVNAGVLLDALPLGQIMYFYKENSIWKCRFVGGRFIFDFGQAAWLQTTGILAPRCVCITGDGTRHVWASQDDILFHDGNIVRSLLTEKQRRRLFNEIDTNNFGTSFMYCNPAASEVRFCYPGSGATYPDRELILSYVRGGDSWPVTEADGVTYRNAAIGPIENPSEETWDGTEDIWDDDTGPWSEISRRRVILSGTDATKFYNLDKGSTRDGSTFTGTVRREALSVLGKKRNGEWITDFNRHKLADMMWPKIQGGPVSVRIGSQQSVEGAISWNNPVSFASTDVYCNPGPVEGRAIAWEISAPTSWRIDGLSFDITDLGDF